MYTSVIHIYLAVGVWLCHTWRPSRTGSPDPRYPGQTRVRWSSTTWRPLPHTEDNGRTTTPRSTTDSVGILSYTPCHTVYVICYCKGSSFFSDPYVRLDILLTVNSMFTRLQGHCITWEIWLHSSSLIEFSRSNGNFAYRNANELDQTH